MLYLITNRKLVKNKDIYNIFEDAVKGGISAIILREKDLSTAELLPMAVKTKEIIGDNDVKLIINSNLQVAKNVEAYGFHTSFQNFIKNKPSFNGSIGVSAHSLEEAIEAEKHGANYLLLSHIFETHCKKGLPPKGIELIKAVKTKVNIPIIALGGIKVENIHMVMNAGADGAAVMSAIMEAENPYFLTKKYVDKIVNIG